MESASSVRLAHVTVRSMRLMDGRNESESDDVLARRSAGDPAAFGELYQRYAADIRAFIMTRVRGNTELADDLSSQVFARALAAIPGYTSGSFRGWLYAIARNLLIDEHRRSRDMSSIDQIRELEGASPHLDDVLIAADARAQLYDALGELGDLQRKVVLLRLHGLSGKEIARRLGTSHEAVKSAQYRAFAKLRTILGEM